MSGRELSARSSNVSERGKVSLTQSTVHTSYNEVDHPTHYNQGKIEVIDFIEDQRLGFHLGNAVKYICRANLKGGESLQKAKWYLQRAIEKEISR